MSTNPNPSPYEPSRPLGVAVLAVLVGLFGFLWILGGALILGGVATAAFLNAGALPHALGYTGLIAGVIVLVVGLIILGLALGLWHLRMWALVLTLLVVALEVISYALAHNYESFGFLIGLLLFVYLVAVHRHFR